ncbi:hypothetical protein DEU50_104224 [Aeromonas salmonicida]|uniref:Uncharacterized protein n=1 Tax=Aeromonas salmonicida TaxID=645 RepID=A0AAX1PL26_AERSA|nr:hypothetical protein DEU50_104224 [Aeromonas salmonicida]
MIESGSDIISTGGEQWIPHAAWFALAITWQSAQGGRHD